MSISRNAKREKGLQHSNYVVKFSSVATENATFGPVWGGFIENYMKTQSNGT